MIALAAGLLALPAPGWTFGVDALLQVRVPAFPRLSPDGAWVAAVVDRTDGPRRKRMLWVAPADALHRGRSGLELDPAASAPAWSPDGRLAVVLRREARPQLALVDPQRPEKVRRWLTQLPTGARAPVWAPDGRRLAFESRVYPECETLDCQRTRLAEAETSRARIYEHDAPRRWARWRDGRARHLFVLDVRQGGLRNLTAAGPALAEPGGPEPRMAFLDPGHIVYVGEAPSGTGARAVDTDLHLVSVDGRSAARLTESPGRDYAPRVAAGRLLYLSSTAPSEGPSLPKARWLDPSSGRTRLLPHSSDHPVREAVPFGPGALLVLDRGGHRPLAFAPIGNDQLVLRVAEGTVEHLHTAASRITAVVSSFARPPEIVVLGADGRELARSRLNRRGPELRAREVTVVRPNGVRIHGFVLSPKDEGRHPTVVLLHGGPESAWTDGWHPRWNASLFAARGFTVLLPNLAGSVGYGLDFESRVLASWGGAPHEDLLAFVDAAKSWPEVAPPVALAGASFGGYLVGWALAQSGRFACGVSHAGVFDPAALWGETDARWFPEWEFGGPPWAKNAVYERWSPARYAHRIRAPMLLTHGGKDFRVPVEQSLRLFSTLKRRGLPVQFLHLPDEGHLIRDPTALRTWYETSFAFLGSCLGSRATASTP